MVIFSAVKLKKLFDKQRNYPWKKPKACPCCNSCTVWGHGFAEAFFDGYQRPLLLKLYRCVDCGCVIRLRPKGYFKRFQASIETIRSSIAGKSLMNKKGDRYITLDMDKWLCHESLNLMFKGAHHAKNSANDNRLITQCVNSRDLNRISR